MAKPSASRVCESCNVEYAPNSGTQRWCQVCVPDLTALARMQEYGLSEPQFLKLWNKQAGFCALCKKPASCVDHCHLTDRIRGLLGCGCNLMVDRLADVEWVCRAEVYIEHGVQAELPT